MSNHAFRRPDYKYVGNVEHIPRASILPTAMLILFCILLAFIYFVWHNDSLFKQPSEFHHVGWEPEHVRRIASDLPAIEAPLLKAKDLPPVTGRRYIVVGGVSTSLYASRLQSLSDTPNAAIHHRQDSLAVG